MKRVRLPSPCDRDFRIPIGTLGIRQPYLVYFEDGLQNVREAIRRCYVIRRFE